MKFELMGICPHSESSIKRSVILDMLPMIINVKPDDRTNLSGCTEPRYRIKSRTANRLRKEVGLGPAPRDCTVCGHMGRLIE